MNCSSEGPGLRSCRCKQTASRLDWSPGPRKSMEYFVAQRMLKSCEGFQVKGCRCAVSVVGAVQDISIGFHVFLAPKK